MIFLFAGVALNVAQVLSFIFPFFDYFDYIDPDGWTISLSAFITLIEVMGLRLISGCRGLRLSLILGSFIAVLLLGVVLVFLGRRTVAFWASDIDLPNVGEWLQVGFSFWIPVLLYHFLL